MPQYTTEQDFLRYNIFTSYFIDGRVFFRVFAFLARVYEYTKIKGLDSGKIASLPKSQNVINYAHHLNHRIDISQSV